MRRAAGGVDGAAVREQLPERPGVVVPDHPQGRPAVALVGGGEVDDEREGDLSLRHVLAERLADHADVAEQVEQIVLDLEGDAEGDARPLQGVRQRLVRPRQDRAEPAARADQRSGLAADDLVVRLLVETEVVAVVELRELPFAEGVRHAPQEEVDRRVTRR